jgi:hypothetical protein
MLGNDVANKKKLIVDMTISQIGCTWHVPLKHYLVNQLSIGIVKTICKMENT